MIILGVLLLGLAARTKQAIPSPCPAVLTYEEKTPDQLPDRWYGQIAFPPNTPHWLFMSIVLDAKAHILGNWLGEVSTQDNTLFRINNPDIKTQREPVRFFVKHGADEQPPKVKLIKLDEKVICNAKNPGIESAAELSSIGTRDSPKVPNESNVRVPEVPYYPPQKVQCGTVTLSNPIAQVVDGTPTKEGQWPWQIALYRIKFVNNNYICGGSLVSHRHVITAAHCTTVKNSRPTQQLDENTLTVYLGKHDLVTSIIGVQIRFVEKITVFPEYNSRTYSRDLSVLLLQEPVQYTGWVQPVCLWPNHLSDIKHVIDRNGSVVGWGNDGSGKLQLVHMPVVSQETCLRSKGDFYHRVTSEYTFCAGMRNGQSTCNGDSGGGMVFQINGAWHLRGLVSLGLSKDNEAVCDPNHFVVFTDLAKFLPWIRENIEPY